MYENHTMDIRYTKTAGVHVTIKYQGQTYVMPYNGKGINTNCGPHTMKFIRNALCMQTVILKISNSVCYFRCLKTHETK